MNGMPCITPHVVANEEAGTEEEVEHRIGMRGTLRIMLICEAALTSIRVAVAEGIVVHLVVRRTAGETETRVAAPGLTTSIW